MEKSPSIQNLAKALLVFQTKMDKIGRDSSNPFFKSKYASLSTILEHIQIPLAEAGLSFAQFPTNGEGLTTILMHGNSGEYIEAEYQMTAAKDDPQGRGSAITYQRRYALGAILGLNIDEDDDGNSAYTKSAPKQAPAATDLPWLNKGTKEWDQAVRVIKEGKRTMEQIKAKFKISKPNEAEIFTEAKK
jgi:hypothetical protein